MAVHFALHKLEALLLLTPSLALVFLIGHQQPQLLVTPQTDHMLVMLRLDSAALCDRAVLPLSLYSAEKTQHQCCLQGVGFPDS